MGSQATQVGATEAALRCGSAEFWAWAIGPGCPGRQRQNSLSQDGYQGQLLWLSRLPRFSSVLAPRLLTQRAPGMGLSRAAVPSSPALRPQGFTIPGATQSTHPRRWAAPGLAPSAPWRLRRLRPLEAGGAAGFLPAARQSPCWYRYSVSEGALGTLEDPGHK